MSLRMRLTLALVAAAIGPMLIAVVATLLRAEKRAELDAAQRIESAQGQARTLLDRHRDEALERLEEAATDLSYEFSAIEAMLGRVGAGREAAPAVPREAQGGTASEVPLGPVEIARTLAERRGLDHLEILDASGTILSTSRMDASSGRHSALADLGEAAVEVRVLPAGRERGDDAPPDPGGAALVARRGVPLANEPLTIVGGRLLDRRLMDGIASITGGAAFLVDPAGGVALRAAARSGSDVSGGSANWISADVAVGDGGWRVRVTAPAPDVGRARRELGAIFVGIAPFALATALLLGVVLAEGISRPIRALASRAEEISAQQAAPIRLHPDADEVRRLTVAFEQMLDALSASEQQRVSAERIAAWQEVAKRIAHEVKNPLSPIKLAVENLLRTRQKAPAELDRALTEESATILEEVESLRRLVDEFSQFARLPAPQPVWVDPRSIVSSALALMAPRIESRRVRVKVDADGAPVSVRVDAEQVGRALKNVLLNALDAMETVAEPRLNITLSENDAEVPYLMIEVRDTGVGIEPGSLRRIFEPYFTTRPEKGGAGLGMAITHRIVFEHGGTIHAASTQGRGTTITIRLPSSGPPEAAP